MSGGIMLLQLIGDGTGRGKVNAPLQAVDQPVAFKAAIKEVSTPRADEREQRPASDKAASLATDKDTADMLAISIILNGYGCAKVKDWSGDGAAGKNIVTCVERKGRSRIVRYEVEPLEGRVVML